MTFQDYLAGQRKRVDDYLSHVLTTDQPCFSRLYEAMNYSLLAGGKRIIKKVGMEMPIMASTVTV